MALPIITREDVFKMRVRQVLRAAAVQYPSMLVSVDFVRPVTFLGGVDFPGDKGTEKWESLSESVEGYNIQKEERWYESGVGVVREQINYLLIPIGYDVRANDEVILRGEPWLVVDAPQALGVQKLKLDKVKARFRRFVRFEPCYRALGVKANINLTPPEFVSPKPALSVLPTPAPQYLQDVRVGGVSPGTPGATVISYTGVDGLTITETTPDNPGGVSFRIITQPNGLSDVRTVYTQADGTTIVVTEIQVAQDHPKTAGSTVTTTPHKDLGTKTVVTRNDITGETTTVTVLAP